MAAQENTPFAAAPRTLLCAALRSTPRRCQQLHHVLRDTMNLPMTGIEQLVARVRCGQVRFEQNDVARFDEGSTCTSVREHGYNAPLTARTLHFQRDRALHCLLGGDSHRQLFAPRRGKLLPTLCRRDCVLGAFGVCTNRSQMEALHPRRGRSGRHSCGVSLSKVDVINTTLGTVMVCNNEKSKKLQTQRVNDREDLHRVEAAVLGLVNGLMMRGMYGMRDGVEVLPQQLLLGSGEGEDAEELRAKVKNIIILDTYTPLRRLCMQRELTGTQHTAHGMQLTHVQLSNVRMYIDMECLEPVGVEALLCDDANSSAAFKMTVTAYGRFTIMQIKQDDVKIAMYAVLYIASRWKGYDSVDMHNTLYGMVPFMGPRWSAFPLLVLCNGSFGESREDALRRMLQAD